MDGMMMLSSCWTVVFISNDMSWELQLGIGVIF